MCIGSSAKTQSTSVISSLEVPLAITFRGNSKILFFNKTVSLADIFTNLLFTHNYWSACYVLEIACFEHTNKLHTIYLGTVIVYDRCQWPLLGYWCNISKNEPTIRMLIRNETSSLGVMNFSQKSRFFFRIEIFHAIWFLNVMAVTFTCPLHPFSVSPCLFFRQVYFLNQSEKIFLVWEFIKWAYCKMKVLKT